MYTPSMALTSHRAEAVGLAQGLAFGVMNTAWAFGSSSALPPVARSLVHGDAVPYLVGASLCAFTLVASYPVAGRIRPRAA